MGITMNSLCVDCLLKKHIAAARTLGDDEKAYAFTKAVMQLFLDAAPEDSSTVLGARINRLYMAHYGVPQDRYQEEKRQSNEFVAQRLDEIREITAKAEDPLLTALQYAILGNYIDFSALGKSVSFDTLEQMLSQPEQFRFDMADYENFLRKLETAKSLMIITDNAGEIGFDLVLAETLKKRYPQLTVTFCVRGMPAHNDATREDAEFFHIDFPVIDSGSDVGGMDMRYVSPETKAAMDQADIIIAKGMGNTETLYGSKYPIYFAFLVKCPRLRQVFGKPHMTPMFVNNSSESQ